MKRIFFILLIIVSVITLSLPQTWNYINSFFTTNTTQNSQLSFKSLFGEYVIYIDNQEIGKVGDKKTDIFPRINAGERNLKIIRISEPAGFYYVLERKINFLGGTQVEIEWESGPTIDSSNGVIRYFNEIKNSEGTELLVIPFPSSSEVQINSAIVPDRRIVVKDTKPIKVNVKASEIYESRELTVELSTIRKDVRHTIEVYLYKKPFIN